MSKQILIDSYFGLVRTAIAEGGELVDYYEESPDQGRAKGNIYRGVVKKVDAPIQAAFVRFAGGRDGFLPLRDAGSGNKVPKVGDSVLVQVVKDEVGDKGAALTTKLSLSGRYLVFIPERESEGGISSRITDEERAALKQALGQLQIPEGGSVILRTAAMNKGAGELQADLDRLTESYREIMDKFEKGKDPALLFREVPPALRYLREYYAPDVERIWVNQEEVLDQCRQFFYLYEPKSAAKVSLSQDGPLMFQKLGLEADVERLTSRKVSLPSGANIVIDQAEALVAIDVNSAKAGGRGEDGRKRGGKDGDRHKGRGHELEATVFAVNKEAAGEIARQLRLRDLGGIIIVDFIDMEDDKHRRQIEEAMRRALAADKAKIKVYEISPLGIMQISRQRLRKAGPNFSRQSCEPCQGRGWHPSPAAGALTVLRKMEERLHGKKAGQSLMVSAPYPVANKLVNEFRDHVFAMEKRFGCTLRIAALPAASGDAAIVSQGGGGEEARSRDGAQAPERAREQRGRDSRDRDPRDERRRGGREEGKNRNAEARGEGGAENRNDGRVPQDGRNAGRDGGRDEVRNEGRNEGRRGRGRNGRGRERGPIPASGRMDASAAAGGNGADGADGAGNAPSEIFSQAGQERLERDYPGIIAPITDGLSMHAREAAEAAPAPLRASEAEAAPAEAATAESGAEAPVTSGTNRGRSRGRGKPAKGRGTEASAESAGKPEKPGARAPQSGRPPRGKVAGAAKPALGAGKAVEATVKAVAARVKTGQAPERPASVLQTAAAGEVGSSPRKPRRRSRRGKGGKGAKGGSAAA
jgi:ribonuclease E